MNVSNRVDESFVDKIYRICDSLPSPLMASQPSAYAVRVRKKAKRLMKQRKARRLRRR